LPTDPALLLPILWQIIDLDGDDVLSRAEIQALMSDAESNVDILLLIADSNGDGVLSFSEISQLVTSFPFMVTDMLWTIDINGDGVLSAAELDGTITAEQFALLDINGDGMIDCYDVPNWDWPPDLPVVCPLPLDASLLLPILLPVLDLDGDGGVSRAELLALTPDIEEYLDMIFNIADTNRDGIISLDEAMLLTPLWPLFVDEILYMIDINRDGVLSAAELEGFINPEQFALLDINGDGVIDCYDVLDGPVMPGEGEAEGENVDELPCPLPNDPALLLDTLWPFVDIDGDGGLSLNEVLRLAPEYADDIRMFFPVVDTNGDGKLSKGEILSFLPIIQTITPIDYISIVDLNGNGVIEYSEVAGYISYAEFNLLDRNGNGVLDCGDLVDAPPIIWEGESEGDSTEENDCRLPDDPKVLARVIWLLLDAYGNRGIPIELFWGIVSVFTTTLIEDLPVVDANQDGRIEFEEIEPFLSLLPLNYLWSVDLNGNGVIEYEEVASFVPRAIFDGIDSDGNGVIDCRDLPLILSLMPIEGGMDAEGEIPGDGNEYCPLPQEIPVLLDFLWPIIDVDADGGLSLIEVQAVAPFLSSTDFDMIDQNGDGLITRDEFAILVPILPLILPGDSLFDSIDTNGNGVLEWNELAPFLTREAFDLLDRNGNGVLDCEDLEDAAFVGENPPLARTHSADYDGDWTISLSEMLRVIQLYNVGGYQCGEDTEDGFAPFKGRSGCTPHDGDFLIQDWVIDLSELLRMIQFYNSPESSYYAKPATEDGFAPGKKVL
jgi:Ca2+-binding EF-hand superfamily protein